MFKNRVAWNKGLTKEMDERLERLPHSEETKRKIKETKSRQINWNKGLTKETDERLRKLSESHKGHPAWNKGVPAWNKGLTKETDERVKRYSKKASETKKGTRMGEDNSFFGKHHAKETKEILRLARIGKHASTETKKLMSLALKGPKGPGWIDGRSYLPYPAEFDKQLKELIRNRDNYQCQRCSCSQLENMEALSVHHIDYVKENCLPSNLISLCRKCNVLVNSNREFWKRFFITRLGEALSV